MVSSSFQGLGANIVCTRDSRYQEIYIAGGADRIIHYKDLVFIRIFGRDLCAIIWWGQITMPMK